MYHFGVCLLIIHDMSIVYKSDGLYRTVNNGLKVLEMYMWLLDSYVLDYFTDCHWKKLPYTWRETLDNVDPQELGKFVIQNNTTGPKSYQRVWPLSLLALHTASSHLSIPREQIPLTISVHDQRGEKQLSDTEMYRTKSLKQFSMVSQESNNKGNSSVVAKEIDWQIPEATSCLRHPKLQYVFTKHVKPKKQHEISRMAQVTASIAKMENCQHVVDIGSGLGHLARLLAYGYGLKVCCLEAQEDLSAQARKLDMELETSVSKVLKDIESPKLFRPVHMNVTLDSNSTSDTFTEILKRAFNITEENFNFGIIGLHPCGDLAPILMNLFVQCPNAKFINIVGCCYMKLSTGIVSGFNGYPMSEFVSSRQHILSYEAREIACHAIETYCQRLCLGQYENLKVHCYRAALEKILVKHWPQLRHTIIKSIKHTANLTFAQYVTLALTELGLEVPLDELTSEETQLNLMQWKKVVTFYTIRLMLAPLVETIILLDRLLFLQELGISSSLIPLFDPILSPRNSILIGRKR